MDKFLHDLREATADVERQLALEDRGWMRSGGNAGMSAAERVENVRTSRIYAAHDPLCRQAIRLWTDYTFGTGMAWTCEDEGVQRVLQAYWEHRPNRPLLSSAGQRRSNDQLMVDGEVFFCLFPSPDGRATVRRIDPLEITEFVTDPDDQESVRYYRRDWTTPQGQTRTGYYRSSGNLDDEPCPSSQGREVTADQEGIVFHFAYNSLGERGVPLLLPVLEWVRLYRRFMASRVAIMLAMSRFAWRLKAGGGPADVAAAQGALDGQAVAAGSIWTENAGVELTPIKADSGAGQAYQDGRMLKLQIFAGTGWPEQYFADVSTGNLATAQTVELPVTKMIQSLQACWRDVYAEMDECVLRHAGVRDTVDVDRDFPAIVPEDQVALASALQQVVGTFPDLADSRDVLQQALMSVGVLDTNRVIDELEQGRDERRARRQAEGGDGDPALALSQALSMFRASLKPEGTDE